MSRGCKIVLVKILAVKEANATLFFRSTTSVHEEHAEEEEEQDAEEVMVDDMNCRIVRGIVILYFRF